MTETENFIEKIPTRSINAFVWVVVILFSIALCGFVLIERPDIVSGQIKLVANNQPFELLAPQTGTLILLKQPNDSVCSRQDIAYILNPTDYNVVSNLAVALNEIGRAHV